MLSRLVFAIVRLLDLLETVLILVEGDNVVVRSSLVANRAVCKALLVVEAKFALVGANEVVPVASIILL